ncbi:MAG: hypothetical protein VYB77_09910, partial [Planctomycetota bacterium]|nr:hypothetical protein [Planctomycetota bacterium]
RFTVGGLRLPRSEEPAETPQEADRERIESITAFEDVLGGLYESFLEARFGPSWPALRSRIAEWIGRSARNRAGAARGAPAELQEVSRH